MPKLVQNDLASLTNEQSALAALNSNYASLEAFSDTVLSRDGTSPNEMLADLDMNSRRILNLPSPDNASEPLRLQDLTNFLGTGSVPTSSSLITFAEGQTGAVNTTVQARLRETLSVHDFGATGNGVTNDTAAIAAAVAAAQASNIRTIFFPQGNYAGSTLTIALDNIVLQGSGIGATNLKFKVKLTGSGCSINDLKISSVSNDAIEVAGPLQSFHNILIIGCTGGIICTSGSMFATIVQIYDCTNYGFKVDGGINAQLANFQISNCGTGIQLGTTEGCVFVQGAAFNNATHDLFINASTARFNKFVDVYFDSGINGSTISDGQDNQFIGCWWSAGRNGGGNPGLTISGGKNNLFTSCDFFNCGSHGVHISGGTKSSFVNCFAGGNSVTAGASVAHGFSVAANVNDFDFIGCRANNDIAGFGTQGWGIIVNAGTSDRYSVIGCDLNGNGNAGGLSNGGTGINTKISGNLPTSIVDRGGLRIVDGLGSAVAAGSTVFIGPNGASANEPQASYVIEDSCICTKFIAQVDTAPGAAKNFTYTLRKNGGDTAITGQISGAASFSVTATGSVSFAAGDNFSLKLVTDAAANVANHRCVIKLNN